MKKTLVITTIVTALCACYSLTTQEREAYRHCINQADGKTVKMQSCRRLLDVLSRQPQHQDFAKKETVRVLDYQRCLDAEKMGGGEAIESRCGQLWKEIQQSNQ